MLHDTKSNTSGQKHSCDVGLQCYNDVEEFKSHSIKNATTHYFFVDNVTTLHLAY